VAGKLLTVVDDTGPVRSWINPASAVAGDCVGLVAPGPDSPDDSCSVVPTCGRTGIEKTVTAGEDSM